jgi:hypothetical protein
MARIANDSDDAREFQRRECRFTLLAGNEQWLADHHDQILHATGTGGASEVAPALMSNPSRGAAAQ